MINKAIKTKINGYGSTEATLKVEVSSGFENPQTFELDSSLLEFELHNSAALKYMEQWFSPIADHQSTKFDCDVYFHIFRVMVETC